MLNAFVPSSVKLQPDLIKSQLSSHKFGGTLTQIREKRELYLTIKRVIMFLVLRTVAIQRELRVGQTSLVSKAGWHFACSCSGSLEMSDSMNRPLPFDSDHRKNLDKIVQLHVTFFCARSILGGLKQSYTA